MPLLPPMDSPRAVFLSYASQDKEAAHRISNALRAAGIEVWFDQSELRGGDAWDQKIRKQIRECALFLPVISASTQSRLEGYFRREWRMAVERMDDMDDDMPFLVPVVIDDTPDSATRVPERFRERQWTRLPGGEVSHAFVERVTSLLRKGGTAAVVADLGGPGSSLRPGSGPAGIVPVSSRGPTGSGPAGGSTPRRRRLLWSAGTALFLIVAAAAWLVVRKPGASPAPKAAASGSDVSPAGGGAQGDAPSIAVLPFANLSEEPGNEYFADGLAEELLNVLSKVRSLRVAARTSAFSFKGQNVDIATIAQKLNVTTVLEGSVRKAGNRVRISTQLINAADGYQLWSETYDRDLADIFAMQSEIAQSVVKGLRSKLPGVAAAADAAAAVQTAVDQRGRNPEAYRLYLQGQFLWRQQADDARQTSLASFQQAVALDPEYALAWTGVADGYRRLADHGGLLPTEAIPRAREAAMRALALQPDLADAHAALAAIQQSYDRDWRGAHESFGRALELAPDNLEALRGMGGLNAELGRLHEAAVTLRRLIALDPLAPTVHFNYGLLLEKMDDLDGAAVEYATAIALAPRGTAYHLSLALVLVRQKKSGEALSAVEKETAAPFRLQGLAMVHHARGETAASDAALRELSEKYADDSAFQVAEAQAYRGEIDQAFAWLERAYRQKDGGLSDLKTDVLLRNLHRDPRWLEFLRKMGVADEQLTWLK